MDQYREEIVVKRRRGLDNFLYAVLCVLMVVLALIAAMQLAALTQLSIPSIVLMVVSGGLAALIYLRKDNLRMEYEYTYTNGEMDFARVMGNNKRKGLGSMRLRNIEACGLVTHASFQRYVTMPGVHKDNWFLNRDAQLFYFYFTKDNKKRMIIIEPTDEMISLIKGFCSRGVYQG